MAKNQAKDILIMAECLHRIDCIDAATITIIKIDRRLFIVPKSFCFREFYLLSNAYLNW